MKEKVLLTFDVEEFDLPLEYGETIGLSEQIEVTTRGLEGILQLLEGLNLKATFFVTARFAQESTAIIQRLSSEHELASHAMRHSSVDDGDVAESKQFLEAIAGAGVDGFRSPRMQRVSTCVLKDAGYLYSSSENPTFLPGRYNQIFGPRTVRVEDGIVLIPASVTPWLRVPLFWLSFKRFPAGFLRGCLERTLKRDGHLCLYFHPWEFTGLKRFRFPRYIRTPDGVDMIERLKSHLLWLKRRAEFATMGQFARNVTGLEE